MNFKLEDYHIQELIYTSEVCIEEANAILEIPNGGFLYYGELVEEVDDRKKLLYNQPLLIKPTNKFFRVIRNACIIKFTIVLDPRYISDRGRMSVMRNSMYPCSRSNIRMSTLNLDKHQNDVNLVFDRLVKQRYKQLGN